MLAMSSYSKTVVLGACTKGLEFYKNKTEALVEAAIEQEMAITRKKHFWSKPYTLTRDQVIELLDAYEMGWPSKMSQYEDIYSGEMHQIKKLMNIALSINGDEILMTDTGVNLLRRWLNVCDNK